MKRMSWSWAWVGVLSLGGAQAYANYPRAQAYFQRQQWDLSAGEFFQAYAYPKDKAEQRKAEWGLAQSLQRLGLFYSASRYYSLIVRRGASGDNVFFRQALEELGTINSTINLGQAHVVQLFRTPIEVSDVPGAARGFFFYYLGVEAFNRRQYEKAGEYFKRVPSDSPYYLRSMLHLGVTANLAGQHSRGISYFESVIRGAAPGSEGDGLREAANLNVARILYETGRYREAMTYYQRIRRESDNWLQAHFEASWAFFLLQKHNNTLGTIHTLHSPFFVNRFFPETYILESVTYLRLCRYDEVKASMKEFRDRYKPVFDDIRRMKSQFAQSPAEFFRVVHDYRTTRASRQYPGAMAILDAVSRTDSYRDAVDTIRFADQELARLGSARYSEVFGKSGLLDELRTFIADKKKIAATDAGARLYVQAIGYYDYLRELSNQTQLIQAEMLLGKIDQLREKLNVGTADRKGNFVGGLQALDLTSDLEYWPFQGEYWEDELGHYVYNVGSACKERRSAAGES